MPIESQTASATHFLDLFNYRPRTNEEYYVRVGYYSGCSSYLGKTSPTSPYNLPASKGGMESAVFPFYSLFCLKKSAVSRNTYSNKILKIAMVKRFKVAKSTQSPAKVQPKSSQSQPKSTKSSEIFNFQ